MRITLQQIRDNSPCQNGWRKLMTTLGNPSDMSITVSIGQVARSNGAQDAIWCLLCAPFDRRDVIRCILPSVKRASIYNKDKPVSDCIDAIERWLNGEQIDLHAAARAAYAAAYAAYAAADAAYAADAAAYAAAYAADAAAYAAYAAADAAYAAYAAARAAYAADAAAYAAEREMQIEDICKVFP